MRRWLAILAISLLAAPSPAQNPAQLSSVAAHIHGEMSFLASDALRGRGSATHDEMVAATYVASQFSSFGLEDAQLQRVPLPSGGATYNAFALLRGSDPVLASQTILLSSHLDHLGVRTTSSGEVIYHGADDDASGTTAVLELARALGALPTHPRRTILFVCFGSEETGGQGNQYFLQHPPLPLASIVANLEFEMIGHADPAIRSTQLWLTGWERSNLGPTLARQGAPLVADPHPEQHFFRRSDNFDLARQGIVAQTVSSYGLGPHYHQPTDDLAHIDFDHLTRAIESMIAPIEWLANTDWKPSWNPGGQP
ncbi:MAG: M20/M25/M40 family metallo-hydrolase [Candidatus Korobacteraceae bacterium]